MEKRDAATRKRERLQSICKRLTTPGALPTELTYAIAQIEYLDGLSKEKALEYLQTLHTLQFIMIDEKTGIITEYNKLLQSHGYKENSLVY